MSRKILGPVLVTALGAASLPGCSPKETASVPPTTQEAPEAQEEGAVGAAQKEVRKKIDPRERITLEGTPSKQKFEGYRLNENDFGGTVTYPNGEKVTGVFKLHNSDPKGDLYPVGPAQWIGPQGDRLDFNLDWVDSTEEPATYTPKGKAPIKIQGEPSEGDGHWYGGKHTNKNGLTVYPDYDWGWKTGALTIGETAYAPKGTPTRDPATVRSLAEAEVANFTGYAKCTSFPADSAFKGYEGDWEGGKPHGRGTLVFKNGQTIQGNFLEGEPDVSEEIKFKPKDGSFVELFPLPAEDGWMRWKDPKSKETGKGDWEKYIWENGQMVRYDMKQ